MYREPEQTERDAWLSSLVVFTRSFRGYFSSISSLCRPAFVAVSIVRRFFMGVPVEFALLITLRSQNKTGKLNAVMHLNHGVSGGRSRYGLSKYGL